MEPDEASGIVSRLGRDLCIQITKTFDVDTCLNVSIWMMAMCITHAAGVVAEKKKESFDITATWRYLHEERIIPFVMLLMKEYGIDNHRYNPPPVGE